MEEKAFEKLMSHSVPQELPIFYVAEVFIIIFKKIIIGPWREAEEANPHPSIPDTWDPSILESP